MPLSRLSEPELANAFAGAHRQIERRLAEPGCTYVSLANEIGITDSALKQFIRRGRQADHNHVRRGAAFEKIVAYLTRQDQLAGTAEADTITDQEVGLLDSLSGLDYRQQVLISYWAVSRILNVNEAKNQRSGKKMSGYYYCYRNGSNPNYLVKSLLRIAEVDGVPGSLYEFFHSHYDSNGVLKESDGMFLSLATSIYLFGDLAQGEGIDFIILKEPLSDDFDLIPAFQVSIDHEHRPFFAKMLCVKQTAEVSGQSFDDETLLKTQTGLVRKEQVVQSGINGDRDLGARLLDHLRVEECDDLVRIELRDVVRRVLGNG